MILIWLIKPEIYFDDYPVARVAVKSGQRVRKEPFGFIKRLLLKQSIKKEGSKSVKDFEPDAFCI